MAWSMRRIRSSRRSASRSRDQSAVGGQSAAIKIDFDGLSAETFQGGTISFTLCHSEALGLLGF